MKNLSVALLLLLSSAVPLCAQHNNNVSAGVTYSIMPTDARDVSGRPQPGKDKDQFYLSPALFYTAAFSLSQKTRQSRVMLKALAGFQMSGGRSRTDTSGYKERYAYYNLKFALMPSVCVAPKLRAEAGMAMLLNLRKDKSTFGTEEQGNLPRRWQKESDPNVNPEAMFAAIFRLHYSMQRFTITASADYGLTELNLLERSYGFADERAKAHNFQLLLGYNF